MKIKNIKLLGLLFGTIAFFGFKPLILSSANAMEDSINMEDNIITTTNNINNINNINNVNNAHSEKFEAIKKSIEENDKLIHSYINIKKYL